MYLVKFVRNDGQANELMPLPQIKKCFYRLRIGRTDEQLIAEMANIFEVSKQAMQIRLKSRNLI